MTRNFAPGNAGLVFYMDIICPLLAIGLWIGARQEEAAWLDADALCLSRS